VVASRATDTAVMLRVSAMASSEKVDRRDLWRC